MHITRHFRVFTFSFILFHLTMSAQTLAFIPRGLFRVRCFSLSSTDDVCSRGCSLIFEFCVSKSNYWSACYRGKKSYRFYNRSQLGSCAVNATDNFPDVAFEADLNDITDFLQIRIINVKQSGLTKLRNLLDRLVFNITDSDNFPGTSFDGQMIKAALPLTPISRNGKGHDRLTLEVALKCPRYRSGPGCRKKCVESPTRKCFANGTWACKSNCSLTTASTLKPVGVSVTPNMHSGGIKRNLYLYLICGVAAVVIVAIIVTGVICWKVTRQGKRSKYVFRDNTEGISHNNATYLDMCSGQEPLRVELRSPYDEDPTTYESLYEEMGPVYSMSDSSFCDQNCVELPHAPAMTSRYVRR